MMNNKMLLVFLILFSACAGIPKLSQEELVEKTKDVEAFQKRLNASYANIETSPLIKDSVPNFKGLDFFDIDPSYIVNAKLIRTPASEAFQIPTSSGREKTFKKYGELRFKLKGQKLKLSIYQNLQLAGNPMYKKHLFLPFTDLSNSEETYGGGRYLDLMIPEKNVMTINFNKAYNPYCAYSDRYNCPIPPKENDLAIAIRAGVKAYKR